MEDRPSMNIDRMEFSMNYIYYDSEKEGNIRGVATYLEPLNCIEPPMGKVDLVEAYKLFHDFSCILDGSSFATIYEIINDYGLLRLYYTQKQKKKFISMSISTIETTWNLKPMDIGERDIILVITKNSMNISAKGKKKKRVLNEYSKIVEFFKPRGIFFPEVKDETK